MTRSGPPRMWVATAAAIAAGGLSISACGGGDQPAKTGGSAPPPSPDSGNCEKLTLAYDPGKGYEASVFVVGNIAEAELDCEVAYLKTTSREAWRLVARGQADAYLDAYGNEDLRRRLAGPKGPVTVVGNNGVRGGVDLLVPSFMYELGLQTSRDLADEAHVGWGDSPPLLTTLPELLPLAEAAVAFLDLDYEVLDYSAIRPAATMSDLFTVASFDDSQQLPNVYLVEGPLSLLATGQGRQVVDLPESAAGDCAPGAVSTLCSLTDFTYEKIVNTEFANSDSPAYNLIYNYRLGREPAADILRLVVLSGYRVNAADGASWVNTHEDVWRRWLA